MYPAGPVDINGEPRRNARCSTTVFVSTCILVICSIISTAVAASLLPGHQIQYTTSVGICQGLTLAVSCVSFVYLGFYLVAARKNDEVGAERPPTRKLHAACFITIRIAAVLWSGAVIASLALCFKKDICPESNVLCRLEKLDLAVSIIAFFSCAMILWCMELCTHPFKTPKSLPIRSKSNTYRVSAIDSLLDRSVSRACNRESCNPNYEKIYVEKGSCTSSVTDLNPKRKSSGKSSLKYHLPSPKIPGAFPVDRSKHFSDCSMSTWSGSTDISGYSGTTYVSPQRPKRARPTSSISSSTKRSPLSTMRYADYPNIPIVPNLHYAPPPNIPVPPIPPAHQWNLANPHHLGRQHSYMIYHNLPLPPPNYCPPAPTPLLPVANPPSLYSSQYMLQRRPSAMVRPLNVRKEISTTMKPPKLVRRKTEDVRVPGAFRIEVEIGGEGKEREEFRVEEGEEIPPVLGRKIETFFDGGMPHQKKPVGLGIVGVEGKYGGMGKVWEV